MLNSEFTGLNFQNKLKEDTYNNGFFYHYYYNGAGVAVADFNNDGLQDIYLVSNLETNKLYLNKGDFRFDEVTSQSNMSGGKGFSTGVSVIDINNDGLMDVYLCKSGRTKDSESLKNELFINMGISEEGIPYFEESAEKFGLALPFNSTQVYFLDYDKDDDLDAFFINHGQGTYPHIKKHQLMTTKTNGGGELLFENQNGIYRDVTESSGIISNDLGYGLGVSIGDFNNDQWPDIYVTHDYSEKDHLYLNSKDGTFKESSLDSFGHISNFSMGTDTADINNDLLLDIMSLDMMAMDNYTQKTSMSGMNLKRFQDHVDLGLHHQYMYNTLQINKGNRPSTNIPLFSDIAQLANVSSTDWSWGPLFLDLNNDGYKDIFVGNGILRDFRNNDFNIYKKKVQQQALLSGKLNKQAYMKDMLSKMPTRKKEDVFYINSKDLTFKPIEFQRPKTCSNGSAYADFDNDGDLDIVINNSAGETIIYRNNSNTNNYLKIKLKGSDKNRDAIGTKIFVSSNNETQMHEHYFARGYKSAMADAIHFGLANTEIVDTVKVRWPNGKEQYITNVSSNQEIIFTYNDSLKGFKPRKNPKLLFTDVSYIIEPSFIHEENEYNDFAIESLLPHKMSQQGPALAVGDINNDGFEDFFVGGAKGQSGQIYVQTNQKRFVKFDVPVIEKDSTYEDAGALFFDADGDGDSDLYVVSGGNEEPLISDYYFDRFYLNLGNGRFVKSKNALPKFKTSGKAISAGDFDNDGDLDLFVGSRVNPQNYGQKSPSYILENKSAKDNLRFVDVTHHYLPGLSNHNMVTDAEWNDIDGDGKLDLLIANEWGAVEIFINTDEGFKEYSKQFGTDRYIGWWNAIKVVDIDLDGDKDIIAGNLGLNYKYKATHKKPFHFYLNDFDQNNDSDIVLAYHENDTVYPLRGRECSSNQMPFIKQKFKTYHDFGKANLVEVYGDKLNEGIHYKATSFASGIFENVDNTRFKFRPFKNENQISSVNGILFEDFNDDGLEDIILAGNLFESEIETPRNDASYGHFLQGSGNGNFQNVASNISGLNIEGNTRKLQIIHLGNSYNSEKAVLVGRSNASLILIKTDNSSISNNE